MPFVSRDSNNQITAIFREPNDVAQEEITAADPEIVNFLFNNLETVGNHQQPSFLDSDDMRLSDLQMVRVIEDLIHVLAQKGVIALEDLPPAAVDRLKSRSSVRTKLDHFKKVLNDEFQHNDK